ncbi:hypothetical protein ACFL53_04200 [Pseudomonadota bacterium]
MIVDKLKDDLAHARANYWIVTVACAIILSLLLNKLSQGFNLEYLIISTASLGCGYHISSILRKQIKTIKSDLAKYILQ